MGLSQSYGTPKWLADKLRKTNNIFGHILPFGGVGSKEPTLLRIMGFSRVKPREGSHTSPQGHVFGWNRDKTL